MLLLLRLTDRTVPHGIMERLEFTDRWAIGLESLMLVIFVASLGGLSATMLTTWVGWLLVAVALFGLALPLLLHLRPTLFGSSSPVVAAALVLVGGLLLRVAVVGSASALLAITLSH